MNLSKIPITNACQVSEHFELITRQTNVYFFCTNFALVRSCATRAVRCVIRFLTMPSKKKKYNARFPAGRIKKIMQTDEEVGKVAQAVPIIISRTLELFVHSLLTKAMQITSARNAKTLSPSHMKQCILSESRFDFLKDLVKSLPDASVHDDEAPTPPLTPAPVSSNLSNTSCASVARYTEVIAPKVSIAESSTDPRTTKRDTAASNISTEKDPTEAPSPPVPQFQISVPTSFNINQPNFYTEVNSPSISTNTPAINASNPPTSNFAHTANLDEDYDT